MSVSFRAVDNICQSHVFRLHLFLHMLLLTLLKVPEAPKEVVPEEKVPRIRKREEAPPTKGRLSFFGHDLLLFLVMICESVLDYDLSSTFEVCTFIIIPVTWEKKYKPK